MWWLQCLTAYLIPCFTLSVSCSNFSGNLFSGTIPDWSSLTQVVSLCVVPYVFDVQRDSLTQLLQIYREQHAERHGTAGDLQHGGTLGPVRDIEVASCCACTSFTHI